MESLFNLTEGPEIRLTSDMVKNDILGYYFENIKIASNSKFSRNFKNLDLFLESNSKDPLLITKVDCKGRVYYWELKNKTDTFYFVSKPRMTGTWSSIKAKDWIVDISVKLGQKTNHVYFNDIRHYGAVEIHTESSFQKQMDKLGFDPLIDDIGKYFARIYRKSKRSSKTLSKFLINHEMFSGVGLYLRSEIMYSLKLYPYQQVSTLGKDKIMELMQEAVKIAQDSYKNCGCVKINYNGELVGGGYLDKLKVFSKPRDEFNNKIIITIGKDDKRSVFWAKDIQVKHE